MERRTELRVPMEEKAQILFGTKAWACVIRDFCQSGLLLDFPVAKVPPLNGQGALLAGETIKVALICQEKGTSTTLRFSGEVRHRNRTSMGVKFRSIDTLSLEMLSRVSGHAALVEEKGQHQHLKSHISDQLGSESALLIRLAQLYQKQLREQFPGLIDRALREVETALLRSSGHSVDSWLRSDFTRAVQVIAHQSHWLINQTLEAMLASLESATSTKPGDTITSLENSLSVVEKGEFEDWLAMSMAIKSVETNLDAELYQLCIVMAHLSGTKYAAKDCPIGPACILKGFRNACNKLELPVSAQPVIYKTLGNVLKNDLKDFYASLISFAERIGINDHVVVQPSVKPISEVDLTSQRKNKTSHYLHSQRTLAENLGASFVDKDVTALNDSETLMDVTDLKNVSNLDSHNGAESSSNLSDDNDQEKHNTFTALQALIKLKSAVTGGSLSGGPGTVLGQSHAGFKTITRREIKHELQKMQKELCDRLSSNKEVDSEANLKELGLGARHIKEILFNEFSKNITDNDVPCVFAEEENERIEITDKLFDAILKQVSGNDILKQWISKLKVVILLEVLRDKGFFANREHPARKLVNQLARLGSVKLTTNKSLQRSLAFFVTRILSEYNGDQQIFETILVDVDKLVERQEKAFQRNAERIARAFEGQQRLQIMRKKVLYQLNSRFSGKLFPNILIKLLADGGWQQLMVVTLLREGEKSPTFNEQLRVLEQLNAWLNSEGSLEAELELDLEASGVLELIDRELTSSGQSGHQQIVDTLRACLLDGLVVKNSVVDAFTWPNLPSDKIESVDKVGVGFVKSSPYTQREDGRWHKRAQKMSLGDWVEINDKDLPARRMRLAWSGSETYRFVYVDSRGLQEIDIALDEFAEKMATGEVRLLDNDDVPLVDQGLHQMVQSVYEDLAGQASCDTLTGLMNRQSFERGLERAVADSIANRTPYTIGYIDVDQFKVINNTHGHLAGDHILKHVAQLIKKHVIPKTICSRIGGNEFGLIFEHCEIDKARRATDKLRTLVENEEFIWKESKLRCTLSIGVAAIDPSNDTLDSVMRKASIACMTAKEHGRNRVVEYESKDQDQARHDDMIRWVQRIDRDLESMLFLRCQEIRPINMAAHPLTHYEILLGVLDEEGNIVPPVNFIDAAEHFGRMAKVDRWVVHNVLHWMEDNADTMDKIDGFSINLSGVSMNDEGFLDFVLGELSATSVPRHKICFEITETAAITNLSDATDFMKVLKKTGCKFSLDDFGTGLSSYEYIQRLPVDYIKIDGVFIKNIVNSQRDQALVKSINELAHFMNVETIAEFVENNEIKSVLKLLGVDHTQGYGIGKPAILDTLIAHYAG